MSIKDELKSLVGKKCWISGNTLEIRERSDAEIISVDDERVVIKHFLGSVNYIPINNIYSIRRKDLESM